MLHRGVAMSQQREDTAIFRAMPFQVSVEDIDRLLTSDVEISRSTLWVPKGVSECSRDGDTAAHASGHAHTRGIWQGEARPINAAIGRHGASGSVMDNRPARPDAPVCFEMGPPGERGELPPAQPSYGAVHELGPVEGALPPKYKRIEKVALTIGVVCTMIFCVSLSGRSSTESSGTSSTLAGRGQNKLSKLSAGCGAFLCPTSGQCVAAAGKCPEGNPFLKDGSIYRALAACSDEKHLCNHAAGAAAGASVSFADHEVIMTLKSEGRIKGKFKACDGFLCPMSGACKIAPANCTEGDPFAKHSSLYWKDLIAAKVTLLHLAAPDAKRTPATSTTHKSASASASAQQAGGAAAERSLHASRKAGGIAAAAHAKKLSAKEMERKEVASEAASLEKSDAAIAASIYDHSVPAGAKSSPRSVHSPALSTTKSAPKAGRVGTAGGQGGQGGQSHNRRQ